MASIKFTSKPKSCICKHDFQDKTYGSTQRLHNAMKPRDSKYPDRHGWRCTVCGTIKE